MSKAQNNITNKIQNSKFFTKLKNIKHIDIIIVIIFICVLLIVYYSDSFSFSKNEETQNNVRFTSYSSYTNDLETRLSNVLSKIDGAGKVSVMITLDGSPELIIAYNTEESNKFLDTNDSTIIKKEPIIISENGSSSPLILSEKLPNVKGVIIVAQGANDVAVKLNLISATTKLLNITVNSIEIFAGS